MPRAKSDENDDDGEQDRKSEQDSAAETDDSGDELTPVRPKIGESKDTLRQRAERFQKRHGGG